LTCHYSHSFVISRGERAPPLKKQLFQNQIQHADKKLKPQKYALPAYHKINIKINYYKQVTGFSQLILAKMTTAGKQKGGAGDFG
jgi:hypothetical protein